MKNWLVMTTWMVVVVPGWGQARLDYDSMLFQKTFGQPPVQRQVTILHAHSKSPFIRYNPLVWSMSGAMYLYQKVLSPQLATNCPYEISCSNFSKECIKEFGIVKGLALTSDRLMRCTPFTNLDFNPIYLSRNNRIVDEPTFYRVKARR